MGALIFNECRIKVQADDTGAAVILGTVGPSPLSPKSFESYFSALSAGDGHGSTTKHRNGRCIPPARGGSHQLKSRSAIADGSNMVKQHSSQQTEPL